MTNFKAFTADELREKAEACTKRSQESWERSGTDGFLSQWGADRMAVAYDLAADIADAGWKDEFQGLYHRESGKRVKAKIVRTENTYSYKMESKWVVLDASNSAIMWLPAYKGNSKRSKIWKFGFEERPETVDCTVVLAGDDARAVTKRLDGGYPQTAVPYDEL